MAVTAYVLINTAAHQTKATLEKLRSTSAVLSAKAVTGPFDIIANVEAEDVNALGEMITEVIQGAPGIEQTLTCIVFETL